MARGVPDEEQVERPGVQADRHPEVHSDGERIPAHEVTQCRAHPVGRPRCASRVLLTPEEQDDGVASPLEQICAVRVRDGQQPSEGGVEGVAHLLCTDGPEASESLGESREPGDVGEHCGCLHAVVSFVRRGVQPLSGEAGDIGQ